MCISESYKSIDLPSVKKYKKSIPKKYGFGDNNWKDEIKAKKKWSGKEIGVRQSLNLEFVNR